MNCFLSENRWLVKIGRKSHFTLSRGSAPNKLTDTLTILVDCCAWSPLTDTAFEALLQKLESLVFMTQGNLGGTTSRFVPRRRGVFLYMDMERII